ncbi:hypothetical protein ACGFNY_34565 [Streptomyces chartreusis]|uniref:hypothetical protein n=1 Tax=Streptomyces chartreusis TaxID=1969 RepID=UPI00371FA2B8
MTVAGVLQLVVSEVPRDAHVLRAQILHNSNTVELGLTTRADLTLVDFRYFLSGQLAVLEVAGYRFTIVPLPVAESVTNLGPTAGLLDLVQLRFVSTQLRASVGHLRAVEICVPGRVPDALCDLAGLLFEGLGSFSLPVFKDVVHRPVEQASNTPSFAT